MRVAAALLSVFIASSAAGDVLVRAQPAVVQYGEVLQGFREVNPSAAVLDVADPSLSAALGRNPAVVVAVGSRAFEIARQRVHGSAVVATAVLASAAQGAEVSAVPMETRPDDALGALAALAPNARTVLALHGASATPQALEEVQAAARKSGLDVELRAVPDPAAIQAGFRAMLRGKDAVWLLPEPRLAKPELVKLMTSACLEERVALIGFLEGMTRAGALFSVSADFPGIGREAARLASDLESRGRDPKARGVRFAPGKITVSERARAVLDLGGKLPRGAEIVR